MAAFHQAHTRGDIDAEGAAKHIAYPRSGGIDDCPGDNLGRLPVGADQAREPRAIVASGGGDMASAPQPREAAAPEPAALPAEREAVRERESLGAVRALDERGNVRTLADVELEMIRLAIDRYGGQMSEVARRLGIGRSTLYRKLKEYGIDPDDSRADRLAS